MIQVIQVGLGPLGQKLVRFALERSNLGLVEAVDIDPSKQGHDLGSICGLGRKLGVTVQPDIATAAERGNADVALLTTVSSIEKLIPQIEQCAAAGLHVVSTCEELSYPWVAHSDAAKRIDEVCQRHGVVCVGTGINPGYLMDYLPSTLSTVCQHVKRVQVWRVQDASKRRGPFQKKIGAGLSVSEFRKQAKAGVIRHVGLPESVHMVAAAMGWTLEESTESIKPVIADRRIRTKHVRVEPGEAAGVEQVGRGKVDGREVIRLIFRAAVGEAESYDTVKITGRPSIESTIAGGVNGDIATCAVTLNTVRAAAQARPGLRTMLDLPSPHYSMAPGCIRESY